MRTHNSAVVVTLGLILSAGAARADEWKELRTEAGRFTCVMPGTPTENKQTFDTDAGPVEATLFMLETDGGSVAYLAGFNDFPAELVAKSDAQTMLDGARDGAVKNVNGKLVKETKISIDGHPGREILVAAPDDMDVKARVYLVKNRLIQFLVVMPKKTWREADVTKFLTSVKLIADQKKKGK